ncbi:cytochrome c-554 domain protein [delta proteobacterium NaphS2]|nr:cytochrome c-554 domain protein [delta proteobacterium NaphS2]
MRRFGYAAGALLLGVLVMTAPFVSAELFGDYVGYKACGQCHQEIVESWKKTPHAAAFETLADQGEEKLKNPGCVRCHVVAMDAEGGFIDVELTPELKGVQCECCHGPGLKHSETEDASDIKGRPDEAACRVCHTKGQDKNFDFTVKSKLVHAK